MTNELRLRAFINPLAFLEVDQPWADPRGPLPNLQAVIDFLCEPGVKSDVDSLVDRYRQISQESNRLVAAPLEENILKKLVWPLRHAKACHMVGNYLGTISLCGLIAEMAAMLLFEISEVSMDGAAVTGADEQVTAVRAFERKRQVDRVKFLFRHKFIDAQLKSRFDTVRKKRREYLHLYSHKHTSLPKDSVEMFDAAVYIVASLIGQDILNGKIVLRPALQSYLLRHGIMTSSDE
ncbi:MAG: hypothetical protein Q8R28_23520 [Dehalococcoidia bacterium]|nr:hypothetical protein [Dehalococcoidia bacterium]